MRTLPAVSGPESLPRNHQLAGCAAKYFRAGEHIRQLGTEMDAFLEPPEQHVIELDSHYDPDTKTYSVFVEKVPEIPLGWAVLLGEAVHNLRTALDYVVFELGVLDLDGIEPPGGKTAFPLAVDRANFDAVAPRYLEGLSTPHRDMIERMQPYHAPHGRDSFVFKILDDLANDNKHRLLQGIVVTAESGKLHVPALGHNCRVVRQQLHSPIGRPLEPGTPLATLVLEVTGPDPEVNVQGDLTLAVTLRDGTRVIDLLNTAATSVQAVFNEVLLDFETEKAVELRTRRPEGRFAAREPGAAQVNVTFTPDESD